MTSFRAASAAHSLAGIRALTLDWYGTLVRGGTDRLVALLGDRVREHSPDVPFERVLGRRERLIASLETREFLAFRARDEWILATLYEEFRLPGDAIADAAALHAAHMDVQAYPDAHDFLARMRAQGFPVLVVSNADDAMIEAGLAQTKLEVDGVVTSEAARAYKPARAVFEAAVRRLGIPAEQVLHVGDSFVADVVGAKRAGLRAAWVARTGLPAPEGTGVDADLVAEDLRQVAEALGRT